MEKTDKIVECVTNISYGSSDKNLKLIAEAVQSVSGQKLLDIDSSRSANRSVLTFAGKPESVSEAAFQLIKATSEIVDMRFHKGDHPRIGAIDVCPLIGLQNFSKTKTVELSLDLAKRVGKVLNIPIYLYELSAKKGYRSTLPQIRRGGYEKLPQKMLQSKWQPDFGPKFTPENKISILKTGATVLGARDILVAFNISLATDSVAIAQKIAYRLRTIGWPKSLLSEETKVHSFKYPFLRAIGWYSHDYSTAQVSFNFLRYEKTKPLEIWENVKSLAQEYGTSAIGCEAIGLIPEKCILDAGKFAASQLNPYPVYSKKEIIQLGVEHFKFNSVRSFSPEHKILEWRLQEL